jgi:hypothetical protein
MISKTFKYPGDPARRALLMTGQEFVAEIRGGGPGYIQVNDEPPLFFDAIICDLCNAEISTTDTCLLIGSKLYCPACTEAKQQYLS